MDSGFATPSEVVRMGVSVPMCLGLGKWLEPPRFNNGGEMTGISNLGQQPLNISNRVVCLHHEKMVSRWIGNDPLQ